MPDSCAARSATYLPLACRNEWRTRSARAVCDVDSVTASPVPSQCRRSRQCNFAGAYRPAGLSGPPGTADTHYGLPILAGGDGTDEDIESKDGPDESDDDNDEETGDNRTDDDDADLDAITDPDELRRIAKKARGTAKRATFEAGKYRTQRNKARSTSAEQASAEVTAERDSLRVQLAFERAAAGRFADTDTAYKLLDRELVTIGAAGDVKGIEDAVKNLELKYPFLAQASEGAKPDTNPFAVRTGHTNGGRKPVNLPPNMAGAFDKAALKARYPALSDRGR